MGINEKNSRWRNKGTEIKQSVKAQLIYLTEKILKILNIGAFLTNKYNDIDLVTVEFELIQDEIDIDSIEKLSKIAYTKINLNTKRSKDVEFTDKEIILAEKINQLIKAVKQLNKKLEVK